MFPWLRSLVTALCIPAAGLAACHHGGGGKSTPAGFTVTPTSGLSTSEAGGTATFEVALTTQPTADVTIPVSSSDPLQGEPSLAGLTFTAADWNAARTVTVTGVDDSIAEGDLAYTIVLAAATSADARYDGLEPPDVAVTNADDDVAGVLVGPSGLQTNENLTTADFTVGLDPADVQVTNDDNDVPGVDVAPTTVTTTESGITATFDVVLTSIPAADVSVTITSGDLTEGSLSIGGNPGAASVMLLFAPGTALTPQTVTVVPADDALSDGNVAYSITTAPASSADLSYDGIDPADVSASNNDDEASPPGAAGWAKAPLNPVLDPGAQGDWDDANVSEPSVFRLGPGSYELWYEGLNATGQKHDQVGRATSGDGTSWTRSPVTPALPHSAINGTFDRNGVGDETVVFTGMGYLMWFGGRSGGAMKTKIGFASSPDGIAWTRFPGNPTLQGTPGQWDSSAVTSPHVILDGITFRMWYQGTNGTGTYRIGYAESSDGLAWMKSTSNPVLNPGTAGQFDAAGVLMPAVIRDGGIYRMWYVGLDSAGPAGRYRIGFAQSADGISWTKYAGNPVLGLGPAGAFDETGVLSPCVLKNGSTFEMWYTGRDAAGRLRIGSATNP